MKKKEILMLILSIIAITTALYFVVQMLFPNKEPESIVKDSDKIPVINEKIDEETYDIVQELKDHGLPTTEGIGKSDLFSN